MGVLGIIYNTEQFEEELTPMGLETPTGWDDLLDERYKNFFTWSNPSTAGGAAIIKGGSNTENAKIFMDWLLTKEVQELNTSISHRYSVFPDVASPEGLPSLDDVDLVDYDCTEAASMKENVLTKFENEITSKRG